MNHSCTINTKTVRCDSLSLFVMVRISAIVSTIWKSHRVFCICFITLQVRLSLIRHLTYLNDVTEWMMYLDQLYLCLRHQQHQVSANLSLLLDRYQELSKQRFLRLAWWAYDRNKQNVSHKRFIAVSYVDIIFFFWIIEVLNEHYADIKAIHLHLYWLVTTTMFSQPYRPKLLAPELTSK